MSYIKANMTLNNKVIHVKVEQLQSLAHYATNLTVVESQSMNLATNVRLVESQSIYSRSNDFNWTAIDDPSEMNYCPNFSFLLHLPIHSLHVFEQSYSGKISEPKDH